MGELIKLDDYRHALFVIRERAQSQRWNGRRFLDLDYFEYFYVPPHYLYGAHDIIFLKVESHAACVCGRKRDGLDAFIRIGREMPFRFDIPVLAYTDYTVPSG